MTLEELMVKQREFARARDWERWHTPKNLVMALSAEVGELTELFQWLTPQEAGAACAEPASRAKVEDEIADVLLYLVRLADVLGVDPIAAADAKIGRNEGRFPPGVGRTALER